MSAKLDQWDEKTREVYSQMQQDWTEDDVKRLIAAFGRQADALGYARGREGLPQMMAVVAFFASVIRSGERWTPSCDSMMDRARALAAEPAKNTGEAAK